MEPFSIATETICLLTAAGKATFAVTTFIHTLNIAAPAELTAINHELCSLCTLLTTLLTNPSLATISPPNFRIKTNLIQCIAVIDRINIVLSIINEENQSPSSTASTPRLLPDLLSILPSLEANRGSLSLALEELSLDNTTPTTAPTPAPAPAPAPAPTPAPAPEPAPTPREDDPTSPTTQHQLGRIMEELARLQGMVEEMQSNSRAQPRGGGAGGEMMGANDEVMLRRYLDGLTSYADTVWSDLDGEAGRVVEEVGERATTPRIEEEVWHVGGGGGDGATTPRVEEGAATPRTEDREVQEGPGGRGVGEEMGSEEMVGEERLESVGENREGEAIVSEEVSGALVRMGALDLRLPAVEKPEIIVWYGQNKHKDGQGNADPYITARRQLNDKAYYRRWTEVIEILEHRQSQFGETWVNCWRIRRYPGRFLWRPCRLTFCSKGFKAGLAMEATRCGNVQRIHAATPSCIPGVLEGGCPETHSTWGMA